jgi:hypothetical protein
VRGGGVDCKAQGTTVTGKGEALRKGANVSELKAAAERLRTDNYSECGDFEEAYFRESNDTATVVFEYLRLTDTTPITPNVLKQVGFVQGMSGWDGLLVHRGGLRFIAAEDRVRERWEITEPICSFGAFEIPQPLWPRNLGELRQLANRLDIPFTE